MKNLLSIILALLTLAAMVQGETYVQGYIGNAVWTLAGSPYIVTGGGVNAWHLTIEAGVRVQFNSNSGLSISGAFNALGTATDSIYITAGDSAWKSIQIESWQAFNHNINYTVFEGGATTSTMEPALNISCYSLSTSSFILNHSTFRNNSNGWSIVYLPDYAGTARIEECVFSNNIGNYLIDTQVRQDLRIQSCKFFSDSCDGLIRIRGYSDPTDEHTSTIYGCQFYNNISNYAILTTNSSISYSVFNQSTSPGRPIFKGDGCYGIVQNCIIWGCDSIATHPDEYEIEYSDLAVPYPGEGNISADPLFVNPGQGNFRLNPGSPCIDSGNPAGWWYDSDGSRADMGISGGSGFVPFPTKHEYPTLWSGERDTLFFYFYNLNYTPAEIQSVYFTNPDGFSFQAITPSPVPAFGRARYNVYCTGTGSEIASQLVFTSPQFASPADTASISLHDNPEQFTPVSGVWTTENSPYWIHENLIVPDGQELLIEPNVYALFDERRVLKVEGRLTAVGDLGDSITLTGNKWGGVVFDSADGENILDYVKLLEANGTPLTFGQGGGIHTNNTQLRISNSRINSSVWVVQTRYAKYGGGLYADNCSLININNTSFNYFMGDSDGGGLYLKNCPQVEMNKITFNGCKAGRYGGGAYLSQVNCSMDSCTFNYCQLVNQAGDKNGIALNLIASTLNISRSLFGWSLSSQQRSVISLRDASHLTMDHSDICFDFNNDLTGIELRDQASTATLSNSIFQSVNPPFSAPAPGNITMSYSIAPETWPGVGNLVGDPQLTQQGGLTSSSPCIDAADPDFPFDPDSTRSDMGVFYYDQGNPSAPITGPVYGVWSSAHGPYHIAGDIYVPQGDTLTMLPGTVVLFDQGSIFSIMGSLQIQGSLTDTVKVKKNYTQPLGFILLTMNSTIQSSQISFCEFYGIGIDLGPTPTNFSHSVLPGVNAENSDGNSITDCRVNGNIFEGTNWFFTNNIFQHGVYWNDEYSAAYAEGFTHAQGQFIGNTVTVSAYNPYYTSYANGFVQCTGEFTNNIVHTTAQGGGSGFVECSGYIHHNMIQVMTTCISQCPAEIYNNTMINADYGITSDVPHSPVKNNIVYNCDVGFRGQYDVQYSCVFNCPTPFSQGATQGIGTILRDPLLINTWFLSPTSPCIDAGDPAPLYNDPDGTRNDMGANYFDQNLTGLYINTTPVAPPVVIPANGGSFPYYIHVMNPTASPQTVQVWNKARNAAGVAVMIFGPITRTLPAGANPTRTLTQYIAGYLSPGTQTIISYVGAYPNVIADSSFFTITKSAVADGGPWIAECYGTGDFFNEFTSAVEVIPEVYSLKQNFPNPFNASTTFQFDLPQAGKIKLAVFDVTGREVAVLVDGWRGAGVHQLTFNAAGLASGIYIARLTIDGSSGSGTTPTTMVQKMVLLK